MTSKDEATDVSDSEPLKLNSKKTPMDKLIWDYQRKESKIAWRWNWLQLQHHELQNQLNELDSFLAKFDLTSKEPIEEIKPESQDQLLNSSGKKKPKPSPSPFEFLAYSDEEEQQHPLFSFVDASKVKKFVDEKKQSIGEAKKKRGRPKVKPGLSASSENISVEIPPKNNSTKSASTPGKKHKSDKPKQEKEDSSALSPPLEPMEENMENPPKKESPRPSSIYYSKDIDKNLNMLPSHFRIEEIIWEEDDFREDEIDEFEGSGSDADHVGRKSFSTANAFCCRCSCCRDSDSIQTRSRQAKSQEIVEVPQGSSCSCTHHCRCRQKKGAVRGRKNSRSLRDDSLVPDSPKIPPKPKLKIATPSWKCHEEAPEPDPISVPVQATTSVAVTSTISAPVSVPAPVTATASSDPNPPIPNSDLEMTVVEPTAQPATVPAESVETSNSNKATVDTESKEQPALNSETKSSDEDTSDEAFATRHLFRELLERKAIPPQSQERPAQLEALPTDFFVVGDALERKRKGKLLSKREREKLENLEQLKEKFNTKLQKMKERYLNSPKPERNWEQVGQPVLLSPKISTFADASKLVHKKKKKNWRRRPLFILSSSSESSDLEFEEQGPGLSSSSHNGVNINEKLEVKIDVEEQQPQAMPRGRPRLKNSRPGRPRIHQPSSPEQYFNPISIPAPENEEAFEAYLEKARIFRNGDLSWEIVLKPLCVNPATNRPRNILVFRKKVSEEAEAPVEPLPNEEAPATQNNPASDEPPTSEPKDMTPPEPVLPKMEIVQ